MNNKKNLDNFVGKKENLGIKRKEIEELFYSEKYETVISLVRSVWFLEIDASEPSFLAWQTIAFEVRCCYQLEKSFGVENFQSLLTKFAYAYLDYLNKINLEKSQQILSELSNKFPNALELRASALRCQIENQKLQAHTFLSESKKLVNDFNNDADALAVLMDNYQAAEQYSKALEAGDRYLAALQQNCHSPLRYFEDKARIIAMKVALEKTGEQNERALASLLFQTAQTTINGKACAYFFLGSIAQHIAIGFESKQKEFRQYSKEVANRFFQLALAENEKGRSKVNKIFSETIRSVLEREFDFSTHTPRFTATKPKAMEKNPTKWTEYGSFMSREGNASEAAAAYLKAYYLSVEQKDSRKAIEVIHDLLPEHLSLLNQNEIADIFQVWQDEFGTFSQPCQETTQELRRIRMLALQDIVNGQYESGSKRLENFLFTKHSSLDAFPKYELIDTLYRLGFFSYWAGLYELTAKAWDSNYERLSEASLKEGVKQLLQMDKVRRFSKYAEDKEKSQPATLDESFSHLEEALNTFVFSQDTRALFLQAQSTLVQLSKAESFELKNLAVSQYQTFERAYQVIKDCMRDSVDFVPFAALVAKVAATAEFVEAYSEWGKLWRNIVNYLQERANSGIFADRLLSFDTEREISKLIGDWQHETRSAARAVRAFLELRNPDIAGYCMEMMHSFHRGGRLIDAAIIADLGIESLKFTRHRMEKELSRETFFIERFFMYHQALEFIETCLNLPELLPETINFFASVYWNISEGFKSRYFFDKPLITDNQIQQEIQREYEQEEEKFFKFVLAFMEEYGDSGDESFPEIDSVLKEIEPFFQENSNSSNQTNVELPLHHQLQIKNFGLLDAQKSLPEKTALLVIVAHPRLQDEYGGILLVTKEKVKFTPLGVFRYEQDILQPMYESWRGSQHPNLDKDNTLSGLAFLYRALIEPFEQDLQDIKHLIVSPSGTFNNVPFAALWNEQNQYYLVEKLGITIIPSGQLLPLFSKNQATWQQSQALLALHPVGTLGRKLPKSKPFASLPEKIKRELSELEAFPAYAEQEYAALCKYWQGELKIMSSKVLNLESVERLTKARLLGSMPSASLIHLSMHGIFSQVDRSNASVILVSGENEDYDLIFPQDIAALDLSKSCLVFLSTCQVGKSYAPHATIKDIWLSRLGEFTGFPRAFFEAGASSVIVVLDNVPAAATGIFAEKFYERIAQKISLWQALAETQREFITGENGLKDFQHPRFWGLYLLLGSSN